MERSEIFFRKITAERNSEKFQPQIGVSKRLRDLEPSSNLLKCCRCNEAQTKLLSTYHPIIIMNKQQMHYCIPAINFAPVNKTDARISGVIVICSQSIRYKYKVISQGFGTRPSNFLRVLSTLEFSQFGALNAKLQQAKVSKMLRLRSQV